MLKSTHRTMWLVMFMICGVSGHAAAQGLSTNELFRVEDPRDDVEHWSGVVVAGDPEWALADDQGSLGANIADLKSATWGAMVGDGLYVGGPANLPAGSQCQTSQNEEAWLPFTLDVPFRYKGQSYRLEYSNDCTDSDFTHHVTLFSEGESIHVFNHVGGYLLTPELLDGSPAWTEDSVFADMYFETLVRAEEGSCPETGPRTCGDHWRDRMPDTGYIPDFTPYVAPEGDATVQESNGSVNDQRSPAPWFGIAVLAALAMRRRSA